MFRPLRFLQSNLNRAYSKSAQKVPTSGSTSNVAATAEVKGLSENCVRPYKEPLGPGAKPDGQYKVPEYFAYNRFSFAEAEIEMLKYRCPQPTAKN